MLMLTALDSSLRHSNVDDDAPLLLLRKCTGGWGRGEIGGGSVREEDDKNDDVESFRVSL